VRGNDHRVIPCGGRGQRSWVFVLVCRTLKISLQKSKGCDWLREASASIRQAGVHGGLAEAIAFANATRYRNGETAQWTARWRQNQRKPDRLATLGPLPVARGKRRKTEAEEMYLSTEVVPDRRTARSSRIASHSALGATSVCGPLRRDPQAGTSRRRDRYDSGSVNGSEKRAASSTTVTLAA